MPEYTGSDNISGQFRTPFLSLIFYPEISLGDMILSREAHRPSLNDETQSPTLFDQCSILRKKLLRIRGFSNYMVLGGRRNSEILKLIDPVSQLWDIFAAGVPLCFLFNQLPLEAGFGRITDHRFDWESLENDDERVRARAIAHFSMHIRGYKIQQQIPGIQLFTVTDLWDRTSTKGFLKVIQTVSAIVDYLPPSVFLQSQEPDINAIESNVLADPKRIHRESLTTNIVKEIIETERKYVKRLNDTLMVSDALWKARNMDPDLLFFGINKLVASQSKFLSLLEETITSESNDQRWGRCFLECEEEFTEAYVSYCANYPRAKKRLESLTNVDHLILLLLEHRFSKSDLEVMLVSPVSRICKYPLLLEALLKSYSASTYTHLDELDRGLEASKRLTEKINEAVRRSENEQTALELFSRVRDWKGVVPTTANFGELLLDDGCLPVTSSDINQEYSADDDFCVVSRSNICEFFHVFLFDQIIILCQEDMDDSLKEASSLIRTKNCPLLLQAHILLEDITRAVPVSASDHTSKRFSAIPQSQAKYPLTVWWKGDDEHESSFTLLFKYEEQMHQWQARINTILQGLSRHLRTPSGTRVDIRVPGASKTRHLHPPKIPWRNHGDNTPKLASRFSFQSTRNVKRLVPTSTSTAASVRPIPGTASKSSMKIPPEPHSGQKDETKAQAPSPTKVEIKVILRDEVFLLRLPLTTTYEDLVAKVLSSSRLRMDTILGIQESNTQINGHHPLRMRYIDEDGDAVSLRSSEDLQMFFEQYHLQKSQPKPPIVLLVGT